jgi:2-aminobenzoate-CoA ligase
VAECAVIAAPDEERGHVVMAYVVGAGKVTAKELQDHVKAKIAPYKYPRRVEFVDALPRTPTGKVQRNVLREWVS